MEKCRTCIHDGGQQWCPSGCTGCGSGYSNYDDGKNSARALSKSVSGQIIAICTACGRMQVIENSYQLKFWHASHYWNDNDYKSVRFDSDNIHLCCAKCNTPTSIGGMSGNLAAFAEGIINKIGQKRFEDLSIRKNQIKKYSFIELEELNKWFLAEIKKLKNELGEVVK